MEQNVSSIFPTHEKKLSEIMNIECIFYLLNMFSIFPLLAVIPSWSNDIKYTDSAIQAIFQRYK